jgi:cytoskeletal protein CcmA (bactofilin family)
LRGAVTAGAINVTGDSILQGLNTMGALAVTGESLLRGAVTAGALNVTGNSILQGFNTLGALLVTGNSSFVGGVSSGTLRITSTENVFSHTGEAALVVEGGVNVRKNLFVQGPSLKIPSGNTADRPADPIQGFVRYNTEYSQFEGFGAGNAWGSLGGVVDIAQTTKVLASATPGITDGNLYFFNVGSETMRINSAGNIGIGTSAPSYKLDVIGSLGASIGLTAGSLNVTGQSLLQGAVTAGALNVTGNSILQGLNTLGALAVTGESFLRGAVTAGALNVTGSSILQGHVTAGALFVTGNSVLQGSVTAGSLMVNTVNMTPSLGDILSERSFAADNGINIQTLVTGLSFPNAIVRSFLGHVSVNIITSAGPNLAACYELKGVQKDTSGSWVINTSFIGDNTGVTFHIDNLGNIKYTSTSIGNFLSSTFKFKANTTSV